MNLVYTNFVLCRLLKQGRKNTLFAHAPEILQCGKIAYLSVVLMAHLTLNISILKKGTSYFQNDCYYDCLCGLFDQVIL